MTLHDQKQFDELVAAQVDAGAAPVKTRARKAPAKKAAAPAAAPATPISARAHRLTGRVCDCTASRAAFIRTADDDIIYF